MLKRKISIFIILILLLTVVIACHNQAPENQDEQELIKIGFVGPFTGPISVFGQFMNNGLELALAELPPAERDKIKIIQEDTKTLGPNAITAVKKLIEADHVNYIIGPLTNMAVLATGDLLNKHQVISLGAGLTNERAALLGDNHFHFLPEIGLLKQHLAEYIKEKRKIAKLAVIYLNDEFGEELREKFKKHYTQLGGKILIEEVFEKGSGDVKTQLTKIKQAQPQGIFIAAYTKDLIVILRQLKELELEALPKFGCHAFESPDVLQEVSKLAEGVVYPYPRQTGQDRPESVDNYIQKYQAEFNFYPDPYSSGVYDSFNILYQAIKECGYENKECVRQRLASIKNYQGANGLLTVDERGVAIFDQARLRTVKNGKFEDLDE